MSTVEQELTEQQLAVVREVARGGTYKEIAARMFVSQDTVKTHARRAFRKLGVRHRGAAVRVLAERGLLDSDTAPVSVPLEMIRRLQHMARWELMADLPSGVGSRAAVELARRQAELAEQAVAAGEQSWAHLAMREITAVLAAQSEAELRGRLVRAGAVLIGWVDDVDAKRESRRLR